MNNEEFQRLTDSAKRSFSVNPEGETSRYSHAQEVDLMGRCILSSVSIPELTERLGREPTGYDVGQEFLRLSKELHTKAEHALYLRHTTVSDRLHYLDRMSVWGGIYDGVSKLFLSLEVWGPSTGPERESFVGTVRAVAHSQGGAAEFMYEEQTDPVEHWMIVLDITDMNDRQLMVAEARLAVEYGESCLYTP